jgi:hypothetical protein
MSKLNTLKQVDDFMTKDGLLYFNIALPDGTTYMDIEQNKKHILAKDKTLENFYSHFYDYNDRYDTLPVLKGTGLPPTRRRKMRSLHETYLICKHYTGCTLEQFLRHIVHAGIVGHYCGQADKWILCNKYNPRFEGYDFGNTNVHCAELGGNSLEDLFSMVDIDINDYDTIDDDDY